MALDLLIPRLEWNDQAVVGTRTSGSPTITTISDTSKIELGMVYDGAGFPAGSTVLSKTGTSLTLSADATGSAAGASHAFFHRFDFRYPPSKDSGPVPRAENKVAESLSGKRQVQTNFIEVTRAVTFGFVNETEKNRLRDEFFIGWAILGKAFRYFYDKADSEYVNAEADAYTFPETRQVKKHPYFLYELQLKMRWVINSGGSADGNYLELEDESRILLE